MAEQEWSDLEDSDLLGIDLDNPTDSTAIESGSDQPPAKNTDLESGDSKVLVQSNSNRRRRRINVEPPLEVFRPGYLWVSDFSSQAWCEQQMEYKYTLPVALVEDPVMTEGSNLHLARELAVQNVVDIKVTSSEDIWAIKIINLLGAIQSFMVGVPIRREIPIFGCPFNDDVFVVGLIDEIRVDPETFDFDILEFKTRSASKRLPSKAQKLTHDLQVMLYKRLFDDLVKGKMDAQTVAKNLKLDLQREFGEDVLNQVANLTGSSGGPIKNLDQLMNILFARMQGLPFISQCLIEYCYQGDKSTIAIESVPYDEDWLREKFHDYVEYWKGRRGVKGVEIEEAWKCHRCDFSEVCEWRKNKAQQCQNKNIASNTSPSQRKQIKL